jgi:hypothetical protein
VAARDDHAGMTNARSEDASAPARFTRANPVTISVAGTSLLLDQTSIYAVFFDAGMTPVTETRIDYPLADSPPTDTNINEGFNRS